MDGDVNLQASAASDDSILAELVQEHLDLDANVATSSPSSETTRPKYHVCEGVEWKRRIASLAHHPLNLCCAQCRLSFDSMLCAEGPFASFAFHPVGVKCHTNYCEQL